MSKKEQLMDIVDHLSEEEVDTLVNIAEQLANKTEGTIDYALLSEEALEHDWLSPEDEEAWKDL